MAELKNTSALYLQDEQWRINLPVDEDGIIRYAQQILQKRFERLSEPLEGIEPIKDYLNMMFLPRQRKTFSCVFLDFDYRVIGMEDLFYGSLNRVVIAPREIFKAALEYNCAMLVLVQNDPSGRYSKPDQKEVNALHLLQKGCEMMEMYLLDYYVISTDGLFSFAEHGYLKTQD